MSPDDFRRLVAAGLTTEQIAVVMEMMDRDARAVAEAEEARKAKGRERWHRWNDKREANVSKHLPNDSRAGVTRVEDITSNLEISGKTKNKKKRAPAARRVAADDFKAELTAILDDERIEALCAVRRKKGATFTAHAGRLLSKALSACPDPRAAADEMVLRNWTGIKPEWLDGRAQRATAPPRRDTYVDAMNRILEGRANGTENLFGSDGDAQRLPAGQRQPRIDPPHLRGGIAGRIVSGSG